MEGNSEYASNMRGTPILWLNFKLSLNWPVRIAGLTKISQLLRPEVRSQTLKYDPFLNLERNSRMLMTCNKLEPGSGLASGALCGSKFLDSLIPNSQNFSDSLVPPGSHHQKVRRSRHLSKCLLEPRVFGSQLFLSPLRKREISVMPASLVGSDADGKRQAKL